MLSGEVKLVSVVRRGGIGVCCQERWNWNCLNTQKPTTSEGQQAHLLPNGIEHRD